MSENKQILNGCAIDIVIPPTAAGVTAINGDVLDMAGYEGVLFIVGFGALTAGAVTSIYAKQDTAAAFNIDPQPLVGSRVSLLDTQSSKVVALDIYRPRDRFVRPVADRTVQNAVIDYGIAIRYGSRNKPVTLQPTDVAAIKALVSPAEGAA